MKITLALVSALAATASAFPVRIIAITSPHHLPAADVPAPCHGGTHDPTDVSPMSALLARLGFLSPSQHSPHPHPHPHVHSPPSGDDDEKANVIAAIHQQETAHRALDSWKARLERLMRPDDRFLPIVHSGPVRILPAIDADGPFNHFALDSPDRIGHHVEEIHPGHPGYTGWKGLEGSNGVKKYTHHSYDTVDSPRAAHPHGHRSRKSFIARLGRALRALTPAEATALMFVLGAGLGSLLHLLFAMVFISIRMLRCGKGCSARRAARKEARRVRKAERKAAKAARLGKSGPVRLEGSENEDEEEEVLPAYAEGEGDRLVDKA